MAIPSDPLQSIYVYVYVKTSLGPLNGKLQSVFRDDRNLIDQLMFLKCQSLTSDLCLKIPFAKKCFDI